MKLAGAYINDDTYGRLVALAAANNRTLAGQCRHLFDRALKGSLQVPDCTPEPAPVATMKPALRAAARARATLKAVPVGVAARSLQPMAAGGGKPQPAAEWAKLAEAPVAQTDYENVPVTGMGVAAVVPPLVGISATLGNTPVTGHPRPAGCTGPNCGGQGYAEMISTHTPTMMKTQTPNTPPRGRCRPGAAPAPGTPRHDNPPPLSPHAVRRSAR